MNANHARRTSDDVELLVFDVEGTLFDSEVHLPETDINSTIWQAIAEALGEEALREEVATHEKWESGGFNSYLDWMRETVDIHVRHGLEEETFKQLIQSASYNPGVREAMENIDRTQYELVLISGGFLELARRAQVDFGINHVFTACEYYFDDDGQLVSYNLLPCDFEGKVNFVELMLHEYGIADDQWVYVGDSKNDVPIADRADFSVGYRPGPELGCVVDKQIDDFATLPEVLRTRKTHG